MKIHFEKVVLVPKIHQLKVKKIKVKQIVILSVIVVIVILLLVLVKFKLIHPSYKKILMKNQSHQKLKNVHTMMMDLLLKKPLLMPQKLLPKKILSKLSLINLIMAILHLLLKNKRRVNLINSKDRVQLFKDPQKQLGKHSDANLCIHQAQSVGL